MTDHQPFLDPNLWDISEGENAVFGGPKFETLF